jgi:catechol 2,3-dioxygenase-like lactoylglutathione lyase family enzyme
VTLFLNSHIDLHQYKGETMTTATPATQAQTTDALKASSLKLHVSLDVKNIDESIRFYSALFDMKPTKLRPGYAKFDAEFPAVNLALQEKGHCCLQGLSHMGIRVPLIEQVAATKSRLEAAGYQTDDEMGSTCCSALQDKVWVEDPSGYRWEVYVFKGDIPAEVQRLKSEIASSCGCVPA